MIKEEEEEESLSSPPPKKEEEKKNLIKVCIYCYVASMNYSSLYILSPLCQLEFQPHKNNNKNGDDGLLAIIFPSPFTALIVFGCVPKYE